MNETINTILKRRSIRQYKNEQISDEELNTILECGSYAPSGMNMQSYVFIAIQNEEIMHEIIDECMKLRKISSSPFYGAPTIILVFANSEVPTYIKDAVSAMENIQLATTSLGLGACFINCVQDLFDTENGTQIKEKLEISSNYKCIGALSLGYIEGEYPEAKPRKENIIKIIK
ncbi:MAG: nitroreductase family protein [Clostridia bacterium]|nr:nitroreductase family protein [Clostridia bacterium]